MSRLGRIIGRVVVALALVALLLYVFGPYESDDLTASFDDAALDKGVSAYFAAREARFGDITPGTQKQVIWAGAPETKTDWAVLYLHGFSATAMEIRPVPDRVAEALGANLVFTRLAGHGRSGEALAQARVADWMSDVAEGLAVARRVADRILILSVSTGGTLAAAAAMDRTLSQDVAGIVFGAPNFGINNPAAPILTLPAARYWAPLLAGREHSFEPANADQARFWTTRYPSTAVLPVAALVQKVKGLPLENATIPALFLFSKADQVVRAEETAAVAARWGGDTMVIHPEFGPQDDPSAHIIAGDIMSPGQTDVTVDRIVDWVTGL